MGVIFVTTLRLLAPLTIFRWPLAGGIFCMIVDALDVILLQFIHTGGYSDYASIDKFLDTVYLSVEAYVSLKWQNKLARNTSILLFVYRFAGFILFEVTKIRMLLLVFPNLFENFYLFYLVYKKIVKKDRLMQVKPMIIVLLILLIPKLGQEYLLHYIQVQPWGWIMVNILQPLGIYL